MIIKDYSKVDISTRAGRAKLAGAVQYYLDKGSIISRSPSRELLAKPYLYDKMQTAIQEFTLPSDMPRPVTGIDLAGVTAKFHQVDDLDMGWEKVFRLLDFTNTKRKFFEIVDISSGLAFEQVLPGEKAKLYKFAGAIATVQILRFGGGLCWDRDWFDDDEFWNIEDATKEFRNTWFGDKAQFHYDLISASRDDSDVAFQGGDNNADKDADTINVAIQEIIASAADLGYDLSPNERFVVVAPTQLKSRITNAMRITLAMGTAQNQINFNVEAVFTNRLKNKALTSAETAKYFVALPERKIQSATRKNLDVLSDIDALINGEIGVGWGRHGAAVGDVNQLRRCATA